MRKHIRNALLLVLPIAMMISCEDIEDKYMYGNGYTINWSAAADSATTSLVDRFWNIKTNFFVYAPDDWDVAKDPGYWPEAHAMDVIIDAYLRTNDKKYSDMFPLWYEGVKSCNFCNRGKGYINDYYDDSEWICLTMLRLYNCTKEEKYLNTAKELWSYIQTGWDDTYAEGGISWERTSHKWSKNACSNGPAAIIAARMYNITKDENDLNWAVKIYTWERDNLYNPASGAIYDNINGNTGERSSVTLSYNQGTFLGAAYELYKITGETSYLNEARKAAYYGISNSSMIDTGNNVLRDEGNGDGGLFKGIFMRYFVQLILEPKLDEVYRNKFVTFFNNNADVLWRKGVNKKDLLFNSSWTTSVVGTTELGCHISGCTMMEAKAYYEKDMTK